MLASKKLRRSLLAYERKIYARSGLPKLSNWLSGIGKRNSIFIWIPKNAGQNVSAYFEQLCGMQKLKDVRDIEEKFVAQGPYTFGHICLDELLNESFVPKYFEESAFVFAISRNPYTRFASLYSHHLSEKIIPVEASFRDFAKMVGSPNLTPIGLYNGKSLSMCNRQTDWLKNIDVNFLASVENLPEDVESISRKLVGEDAKRKPILRRPYEKNFSSIEEIFDDYIISFVKEFYSQDFKDLGYSTSFADRAEQPVR